MTVDMHDFNLQCDMSLAAGYTSRSQIARVLSENWVTENMYCLGCKADRLEKTIANTQCLDFMCNRCLHKYELKTFLRRPGTSLVDGAYSSMKKSLESGAKPTLLLLQRDTGWKVNTFTAIHPAFLTLSLIEARKPLSAKAKRAGWVGCNIRLDRLPQDGELTIISDGHAANPALVRKFFQKHSPLTSMSLRSRGWTSLTLSVARRLNSSTFSLSSMYESKNLFQEVYPGNGNKSKNSPAIADIARLRDCSIPRSRALQIY